MKTTLTLFIKNWINTDQKPTLDQMILRNQKVLILGIFENLKPIGDDNIFNLLLLSMDTSVTKNYVGELRKTIFSFPKEEYAWVQSLIYSSWLLSKNYGNSYLTLFLNSIFKINSLNYTLSTMSVINNTDVYKPDKIESEPIIEYSNDSTEILFVDPSEPMVEYFNDSTEILFVDQIHLWKPIAFNDEKGYYRPDTGQYHTTLKSSEDDLNDYQPLCLFGLYYGYFNFREGFFLNSIVGDIMESMDEWEVYREYAVNGDLQKLRFKHKPTNYIMVCIDDSKYLSGKKIDDLLGPITGGFKFTLSNGYCIKTIFLCSKSHSSQYFKQLWPNE